MSKKLKFALLVASVVATVLLVFHPSRPLYMRHRDLDVTAPDGTILRATLSLPRWRSGPLPSAVLVHGSGRLAREHVRGDVRDLVWHGLAVLAYDKRGVGASGGEYPTNRADAAQSTLRLLAGDAAAALQRLRREPDVDPQRVGFFGGSQASWIIPLAAESLAPPPRFHIILSGAAVSTGVEQLYSDLTGDGHRAPSVTNRSEIERRVNAFDGEVGFDPQPLLAASRVPTLWLLGDRDESVPVFATVRVLQSLPPDAIEHHTLIRFANAGHDLRDVDTGEPSLVWADVFAWLRRVGVTGP